MKLTSARVRMFKHILDSDEVAIQPDVTCMVGKNESGKTAFLQALRCVKAAKGRAKPTISSARQYPAWLEKKHRRERDLERHAFVSAVFEIGDDEFASLENRFGPGFAKSRKYELSCYYDGGRALGIDVDEAAIIAHMLRSITFEFADGAVRPTDLETFDALTNTFGSPDADVERAEDATRLLESRKKILEGAVTVQKAVIAALDALTPEFFYFSEYSSLPAIIPIRKLFEAKRDTLSEDEMTAVRLLELAGAEDDYLQQPDYETRKRELENVANELTSDILEFWKTNQEIRVEIDISSRVVNENRQYQTPQGPQVISTPTVVQDDLRIRLRDDRHKLSLPFDERSTGFRWFFSFLAAFSAYEASEAPLVILLDEPGLGLHARAQADFLRFIDERLGKKRQVIYTTHSPFMVEPSRLDRVRLVEDKGTQLGSKVSADVLTTDRDTIFPLQAALGYDLAQHLFIGPHSLLVEGTSDFTYLDVMSRYLVEQEREGLDRAWAITPIGGADNVPTFVALLGQHLDVTVVLDSRAAGTQRLDSMVERKLFGSDRIIMLGRVLGRTRADIEDVFAPADYLMLYNAAFGSDLKMSDLSGDDPIVDRIARKVAGRYDHGKPADVFLRRRDEFLPTLQPETLDAFEKLFRTVNATLIRET